MAEEEKQLSLEDLLPAERPEAKAADVPLAELPAELVGPEPDKALVASVKRFGVLAPVTLADGGDEFPDGGHDYFVIDGRRRIKAARLAGLDSVPARIYPLGAFNGDVATLATNTLRRPNPVAEFLAVAALLEQGASEKVIAQATGASPQTIKQRLRLYHGLIPELRAALTQGKLAMAKAESCARLGRSRQERLARVLEANGKLSEGDIAEVRQVAAREVAASLPAAFFGGPSAEEMRAARPRLDAGTDDLGRPAEVSICIPEEAPENPYEGDSATQALRRLLAALEARARQPRKRWYDDELEAIMKAGWAALGEPRQNERAG